jgi:hypothetical protein
LLGTIQYVAFKGNVNTDWSEVLKGHKEMEVVDSLQRWEVDKQVDNRVYRCSSETGKSNQKKGAWWFGMYIISARALHGLKERKKIRKKEREKRRNKKRKSI